MSLYEEITYAIEHTPKMLKPDAKVACQGVEGAFTQIACEKIFARPEIDYKETWKQVFEAIDKGECEYGVLPIENSTAGSVRQVYDLLIRYNCSIVRSARIQVYHNLLAKDGVKLEDIREIVSHEQAIDQCSAFLESLPDVKVTKVANTAIAAKMVSESERRDFAAISSINCANLYHLGVVKAAIQNKDNNYTRFICISKERKIFPGADKTSLMLVLKNRPGALYSVLELFAKLGINLIKLESRPLPERDFEYMFYFDIELSVYADELKRLIESLPEMCTEYKFLGSYIEKV